MAQITQASLLQDLKRGATWLDREYAKQQGQTWDAIGEARRLQFADILDKWCMKENQVRFIFEYQGCVLDPKRCASDGPVRCDACAYV